MDFKNLLSQLDQLSEAAKKSKVKEARPEPDDEDYDAADEADRADTERRSREEDDLTEGTEETSTGKKHTADAGGYGRKDDEDDEGKKVKQAAAPRGRGRPKKDADETGETKKYDWSQFGGPSADGKKKDVKLPKWDKSKTTKHSLKDWFERVDQAIMEGEQIQIKPASQMPRVPGQTSIGQKPAVPGQPQQVQGQPAPNTQVIAQGNKTLGTVNNPQLAQQIKQSIGKGEMTLMPDQEMAEGEHTQHAFVKGRPNVPNNKTAPNGQPKTDWKRDPITAVANKIYDKFSKPSKVNEGSEHRLKAAHHAGKSHALSKQNYSCKYDDMEEARMYHDGYKEGLDECYGQAPIAGMTPVDDMAHTPRIADEGNAFGAAIARTPAGGQFKLGGNAFTDNSGYDAPIDEMAFESWNNQLNSILTEGEKVDEGMTVSISKGQQGSPDSVSVTAQDQDADQLLAVIKQAGLGLFGGEETGVTQGSTQMSAPMDGEPAEVGAVAPEIEVVGDHDNMLSLMKTMTGGEEVATDNGYEEEASEEEHAHDEACGTCGSVECQCDEEPADGTEEEPSTNAEEESASEDNAEEESEEETSDSEESDSEEEEKVDESYANSEDDGYEADLDFIMKAIAGGLNKPKADQTTLPHTAVNSMHESITDWKKLAGI